MCCGSLTITVWFVLQIPCEIRKGIYHPAVRRRRKSNRIHFQKLASGKRIHELELLKRTLQYRHGIIGRLQKHLSEKYHCEMDEHCMENVVNMMTNEFPTSAAKKTYAQLCISEEGTG